MFYVYVVCMGFFNWFSTCATFELVKSPEVTLCDWLGYKPSINNNNSPKLVSVQSLVGTRFECNADMTQVPDSNERSANGLRNIDVTTREEIGGYRIGLRLYKRSRERMRLHSSFIYSPVNRTGSPQGFSLNQILHKSKTIQNMHILQT